MTTIITGMGGGYPFEIMLTWLTDEEMPDHGVLEDGTALLTVRQKDTDLGILELEKLGNACIKAAKMLKRRKGKG